MKEPLPFGEWLRKQRRALDLSRQDLADQAGCAEITLRRIEAGTLKPSKELASLLLEKVGIPQHELELWVRFARGQSGRPLEQSTSESEPRTNLPALWTSFIGREKEQAEVIQLLEKYRLVTLVGPGGVGKTRLSFKVGEQALSNYADGVWLVELAPLNDPELIPQTITSILGARSTASLPVTEVLINYLRAKTILLILDNCEHLLDVCAHLTDTLLKNCPSLKILATSRGAMGILGEATYLVPSLGVPDARKILDTYREFESVRLFEERAQLVKFDFSLTTDNASFVAQICSRLDGIPLAIELAAVHVNRYTPSEIAARLEESFQILTGGSRTALPRQQTLRASIDWSYELLDDAEKALFARLGVFVGGWTLEFAESVCGSDLNVGILSGIESLLDKSLIRQFEGRSGEPRFTMLETIREYAFEKLSQSRELDLVQQSHATTIATLVEKARVSNGTPEEVTWFTKLDDELDNLRSAVDWTLANAQPALAFAASRVHPYWYQRTIFREPLSWVEHALTIASTEMNIDRAHALIGAGNLSFAVGNLQQAKKHYETALAFYREMNEPERIASCLINLGSVAQKEKDFERARQLYEQALTNFGPGIWVEAVILNNLGNLARVRGDWEQSREYHLRARDIFVRLGAEAGVSRADWSLGTLDLVQRNLDEAQAHYENSMKASWFQNNPLERGMANGILGYIFLLKGQVEQASPLLIEGLESAAEYMSQVEPDLAFILEGKARLELADGQPERAAQLFGASWNGRYLEDVPLSAAERPNYEAVTAATRSAIGDEVYNKAFEKGKAMSTQEALAFALEDL